MENNNLIKRLVLNVGKDTLLYIPSKLFPALFGFIGLSIYTRIFSPNEYGDYSLIMATVGIAGIFAYSWINQSNLRFYSPYRIENKLKVFFSTSFFTLVGTLAISSLILIILSKFSLLPYAVTSYIMLVIGVMFTMAFFETLMTILRADRKPKSVSLFRSLSSGLCLAISLLLIYIFNLRISAILLGYILTNLILSTIIILKFKFYKYIHFRYFSRKALKEYADYGIPLIATLLFSWILALSDRYIIEYFRGSAEVGIYSAAYQLAEYPISLISSIIVMAAFPIIIDTWEKNGDEPTKDLISNVIRYYLLLAIPSLVGIIVLSKDIMLILGKSYSGGYGVLPWVCFGSLMYGLCVYVNKGLELKKNTKVLSFLVGMAGISNIAMNFLLIPKFGFFGAAVATGSAYLIYFILSVIISKSYLKLTISGNFLKNILIGSILTGIALFMVKKSLGESFFNLLLLICFGVIIYFIVLFLTGEIKNEAVLVKNYLISIIK